MGEAPTGAQAEERCAAEHDPSSLGALIARPVRARSRRARSAQRPRARCGRRLRRARTRATSARGARGSGACGSPPSGSRSAARARGREPHEMSDLPARNTRRSSAIIFCARSRAPNASRPSSDSGLGTALRSSSRPRGLSLGASHRHGSLARGHVARSWPAGASGAERCHPRLGSRRSAGPSGRGGIRTSAGDDVCPEPPSEHGVDAELRQIGSSVATKASKDSWGLQRRRPGQPRSRARTW